MSRKPLAALAAVGVVALTATPAAAVQTDTFALRVSTGAAGIVLAPASTTHATLVATNRSTKPLTITLDRVEAVRGADGVIAYGPSGRGLAQDVGLRTTTLHLKAHESTTVPVSVRSSVTDTDSWAAVTATVDDGSASGVRPRLAVLVHATSTVPSPGRAAGSGWTFLGELAGMLGLVCAVETWRRERIRRRRRAHFRAHARLGS